MAKRRMFTMKIVDSDAFLDMPLSTQALYFHLSMRADDDGFVDNPKKIMRMIGASDDDANVLIAKKFVITFESGIIVIKHWKMHNYIQSDRYEPTSYKDEKERLLINENKSYSLADGESAELLENEQCIQNVSKMDTSHDSLATKKNATTTDGIAQDSQQALENEQCIQNVSKMDTQYRLGKDRLVNNNNIYSRVENENFEQIINYLNSKANTNYRANTKNTRKHIHARLSEGYTVKDFFTVIDKKCDEWIGTDYEKFLRPETLFSTKFESYLNQKTTKTTKNAFLRMLQEENHEQN